MSQNHRMPARQPLCAAYAASLPLLSLRLLDPAEAASLRQHIGTCASCQSRQDQFDHLRDALRREDFASAEAVATAPAATKRITLAEVLRAAAEADVADDREDALEDNQAAYQDAERSGWRPPAPTPRRFARPARRRLGVPGVLGAIAAALLIALFGALLAQQRIGKRTTTPTATVTVVPTATLDPATQGYVRLLRQYYTPVADHYIVAETCWDNIRQVQDIATATQQMAACREPTAAELASARTLARQLAGATPPARWQTEHAALVQAVQSLITILTAQLQAIDAHDVNAFENTGSLFDAGVALCDPIHQLNAGPPPLSPNLSTC